MDLPQGESNSEPNDKKNLPLISAKGRFAINRK